MKTKYVVSAICLILFFSMTFAENTAPIIDSFEEKSGEYTKEEGSLFEFEVIASDPENDSLTYTWNFGDNSGPLTTIKPQAAHNFYSDKRIGEEEFTVTIKVSDGSLNAVESLEIKVKKSMWKAMLIKPNQTELLSKKDSAPVQIEIVDRANQAQGLSSVNATVKLNGEKIETEKVSNSFKGTLSPNATFNNLEFLEINATRGTLNQTNQRFPLFFSPLQITIEKNPLKEKELFVGSNLGKVKAQLNLDGEQPESGTFTATLLSNEEKLAESKMSKDGEYYSVDLDYTFSLEDLDKNLVLKFYGMGSHGNQLSEEFEVKLKKESPLFNLSVKSLENNDQIGFGQPLELNVLLESKGKISKASVTVLLTEQGIEKKLSGEGNEFTGTIKMPSTGESVSLEIIGTATINGQKAGEIKTLQLNLTSELNVSFIYPKEGKTTMEGNGKTLYLNIAYPNGQTVERDSFQGIMYIDGEKLDEPVLLEKEARGYAVKLEEALTGEHSLELSIPKTKNLEGSAKVNTNIVPAPNLLGLILMAGVIIVLGGVLVFIVKKFKSAGHGLKEQIEGKGEKTTPKTKLEKKKKHLEKERKKLEMDFYRRKISENEFRKKMLKLQRKARKIKGVERKPKSVSEVKLPPQRKPLKPPKKPEPKKKPVTPPKTKKEATPKEKIPSDKERTKREATEIIRKKIKEDTGLKPLIIGKNALSKSEEKKQPVQKPKLQEREAEPKKPRPPKKPLDTVSKEKKMEVKEKLERAAVKEGTRREKPLSEKEKRAVKKLVSVLEPKASAFTRGELLKAIKSEGFSERVAQKVVSEIFD